MTTYYHTYCCCSRLFLCPPPLPPMHFDYHGDIVEKTRLGHAMMRKLKRKQSRIFLRSRFCSRIFAAYCTVLFRSVPRRRAYIRPRTFDLRGLDGIPWMRNVIPYTTPLIPRLFSRPVTSGHITTPHPMWNFAFQSCPRSNKWRQLPTGNIFSAKGWAIYLERKRLDTNTRESGSTGMPRSLSLAENPWESL